MAPDRRFLTGAASPANHGLHIGLSADAGIFLPKQPVKVYEDRAVSGASRFRADYQQLLADAERKGFDVVVAEALDRLGRKLADVADLFDRMSFLGIKLHAASTGEVFALHIGMLGTMAQMYLSDLREKTRRGQLGRALKGKIPGGLAFGYEIAKPSKDGGETGCGERRIKSAEVAIVRRIFEEFASGLSPRAIAARLNAEAIPGPGGRLWGDTTIRGQAARSTGILNNALYVGRLEWNRCSYVKDPRIGRRVARVNAREAWEVVEAPELRIISDDLWERVKARQREARIEMGRGEAGNALNRLHRRHFLLSGLLVCGVCGGGYTIIGKDRYGCATRRSKGTCTNSQAISRQEIEARVLGGLKEKLMAPELVEAFVAEFQVEADRLAQAAEQSVAALRQELASVERGLANMLKAIEDGLYNSSIKERMAALETRKAELEAAFASAPPPTALRIHPNLPQIYREKVERLEEALNDDGIRDKAAEVIRGLVERIVLTPSEGGLKAELYGDLARILALREGIEQ